MFIVIYNYIWPATMGIKPSPPIFGPNFFQKMAFSKKLLKLWANDPQRNSEQNGGIGVPRSLICVKIHFYLAYHAIDHYRDI